MLRSLPSKMLIGAKFWRENQLVLDLSALKGRIRVTGKSYSGSIGLGETLEEVRAIPETETSCGSLYQDYGLGVFLRVFGRS